MSTEVNPTLVAGQVLYEGTLEVPAILYGLWCQLVGDRTRHHVSIEDAREAGLSGIDAPGGLVWERAIGKLTQVVNVPIARGGTTKQLFLNPIYPQDELWMEAKVTKVLHDVAVVHIRIREIGDENCIFITGDIIGKVVGPPSG